MKTVIAIDGPAASGKSSVAKQLAQRLDLAYVNSGTFYRVMTWWILENKVDPTSTNAVAELIGKTDFTSGFDGGEGYFHANGQDGGEALREEAVNRAVSPVASSSAVREVVTRHLRDLGKRENLVMEGRDIGSVVFPDTPFKFYIDASPEVRAQRRAAQGQLDVIAQRDQQDSSRAHAPLTIAPNAIVVDSSYLSIEGVRDAVLEHLRAAGLTAGAK